MEIYDFSVTFSEVPDRICATVFAAGCPNQCKDCAWRNKFSKVYEMDLENFEEKIKSKKRYCDVVCFLGGEWNVDLVDYLDIAIKHGMETCLYTGLDEVDEKLKSKLTYLKTGKYIEELGSLYNSKTNQKFFNLKTNTEIKIYEQRYC